MVYRFNDAGDFIDKGDGAGDVIQHGHFTNLLPWIRDVFEELHHSVWDVFESAEMNALIVSELAIAHVTVVLDDLTDVLGR
jgi:hypothetical protein